MTTRGDITRSFQLLTLFSRFAWGKCFLFKYMAYGLCSLEKRGKIMEVYRPGGTFRKIEINKPRKLWHDHGNWLKKFLCKIQHVQIGMWRIQCYIFTSYFKKLNLCQRCNAKTVFISLFMWIHISFHHNDWVNILRPQSQNSMAKKSHIILMSLCKARTFNSVIFGHTMFLNWCVQTEATPS